MKTSSESSPASGPTFGRSTFPMMKRLRNDTACVFAADRSYMLIGTIAGDNRPPPAMPGSTLEAYPTAAPRTVTALVMPGTRFS